MHHRLWSTLGLLSLIGCATSNRLDPVSADHGAVLETVQAFFDAMAEQDVEASSRVMIPEGVFIRTGSDGGRRAWSANAIADYLERLPTMEGYHEEFEGDPIVLIDGDVATVWGRYRFCVDGELSHTGTDAFTLVRTDEGWRLTGGAYSVVSAGDGSQ